MRIFMVIWLILACAALQGQNKIRSYEYWFDGNYATMQQQAVTPASHVALNTIISVAGMGDGMHTISLRFKDDSLRYSTTIQQYFYKYTTGDGGVSNINAYQYWFDSDIAGASLQAIAPVNYFQLYAAIGTAALTYGFHQFHIRFRDNKNQWSSTISQLLYIPDGAEGNTMIQMLYWFDDNISEAQTKTMPAQPLVQLSELLNAAAIADGLHFMHVRFADAQGKWSSPLSQFFYKSADKGITTNIITGYRYWFNNDEAGKMVIHTTPPQNPLAFTEVIDMGCLTSGLNQLHLQFSDAKGLWSSPLTDTISVTPPPGNIYRFTGNGNWSNAANWFNNNEPALDLPGCKEIIIDHTSGGQCVLDVPQFLLKNAKLTVLPGKYLVIPEQLMLK